MPNRPLFTQEDLRNVAVPARWVAAVIAIFYGFAKLNGSQFTIIDSELARPMGEVSGFWLLWYFFGYSSIYGTVIALTQVAGGLLLAVPRTALLGALVLLPVVANIILVDVLFGVGALPISVLLFFCLVLVVIPELGPLKEAVLPSGVSPGVGHAIRTVVVVALLAVGWGFTYWTANYNNRVPTEIDGVWRVEAGDDALEWVYFERNRAFLAVFRPPSGPDAVRHFEVGADGEIRIWDRWLQKGELLYDGRSVTPDRIELLPAMEGGEPLVLRREGTAARPGEG